MPHLTLDQLRSEAELKEGGFRQEDIERFVDIRGGYYNMLVDYDRAVADKDYKTQLDIEERQPVIEAELRTFGAYPKDVPLADLKLLAHMPHGPFSDDAIVSKYKERIKNPATGIRAFCIECQGGSLTGVSECAVVNCPLYYFRDGKNPLFGRTLPPANFMEIEGDDVGDIDELQDGGDAE